MEEPASKPGLLDNCMIAFVPSKSLSTSTISQLSQLVRDNGAEVLEPDRKGKIRIPQATHVVSNTIDFDQYTETLAMMIPVVRSDWIKMSLGRNKLAQVRPYSPDPRLIFASVILTCADIPDLDKEAIIGATMALGGMESKDLTRQTTHICALTLEHPKCEEARKKHPKCKIVLPHWFDDCFRLGRRIDEGPYMLPDPEILRKGPTDEVKIPSSQHLQGAISSLPSAPLDCDSTNKERLVVFNQRKVLLSPYLPINAMLRKTITDKILAGDGEVVDSVEECTMFICQYRDGEQYVKASQLGKDVGNLAWLYYLMVYNEWTNPCRRLLHYPVPRDGIPGFKDMRITLSNYGGDARIYLENLIVAAGATYTKTMKSDNTHLITARNHSEKCEAAKDWNIEIVNHLWIEESYAACAVLPLSNPKYQHFPLRTNLGEVIGQTFLDEQKLQEIYFPGGENEDRAAKKRRKIVKAAQENIYSVGLPEPALEVLHDASPALGKSAKKTKKTTAQEFATPAKGRHILSGKENETPTLMSSGSRSAKAQALSKLHNLAPDIALYEKEKKRSAKDGHGVWGGKRAADQIDKERSDRSSSPADLDDDDSADEVQRPAKRAKTGTSTEKMRICLTGYSRWVGDKTREDADRKKLRSMGIMVVQENVPCDYLAAPAMVRTKKFLRTLARGPEVINSSFITACLEAGERVRVKDYLLDDKDGEDKFGVNIQTAVSRARQNRGRLLWGIPIYCTADIKNGVESFQAIAEANGAIFKVYRARSGTTIRPTTEEEDGGAPPEPVYLLTSSSASEKQLWPKFEEMAVKGHMEPRIVVVDWLLDVAMRQELFFEDHHLAVNNMG